MEWSTGNSYQAEALTNVLRYHTCRSSLPEDRKLPITELKWDARTLTDIPGNTAYWFFAFFWLTEDSRARITKYLNKYVRRGIYLIYMSSFYFWSPPLAIGKPSYFSLPPDIGFISFTPIKGRIDSLTVYIYKAEFPVDHSIGPVEKVRSNKPWSCRSKLPAVQPLWLVEITTHIFIKVFGYSGRHGDRKGMKT
jgi:hypothetical protein